MARVAIKLHGMEQVDSQPAALCRYLINDMVGVMCKTSPTDWAVPHLPRETPQRIGTTQIVKTQGGLVGQFQRR